MLASVATGRRTGDRSALRRTTVIRVPKGAKQSDQLAGDPAGADDGHVESVERAAPRRVLQLKERRAWAAPQQRQG